MWAQLTPLSPAGPIRFEEIAQKAGLHFVTRNFPTPNKNQIETMVAGAEIPSLQKTSPDYCNRLYHNNHDGTFTDVTDTVDNLALQVGVINDVKIHDAEGADSSGGQIQNERRSQAAGSNTKHLRLLQLELTVHADFLHDQVARIAQDFIVAEGCRLVFGQ
jgi:hypothetical protein